MTVRSEDRHHLKWMVSNRNKIQEAIFTLYLYMKDVNKFPENAKDDRVNLLTPAHYLAGVAFSLWRAVFLAERTHDYKAVRQGGLLLLKNLVENNSIGYQQDKDARQWSYGYYVNNASIRLLEISKKSAAYRHALIAAGLSDNWYGFVEQPGGDTSKHWDDCMGRFEVALNNLDAIIYDEGWGFLKDVEEDVGSEH